MTDVIDREFDEEEPAEDTTVPATEDFVEHVGFGQHGVQFVSKHTLTRAQLEEATGHKMDPKELVWKKDARGKMRMSTKDMAPETVEALLTLPEFKRVTD